MAKVKHESLRSISAGDARQGFAGMLEAIENDRVKYVIERHKQPIAVLIPYAEYAAEAASVLGAGSDLASVRSKTRVNWTAESEWDSNKEDIVSILIAAFPYADEVLVLRTLRGFSGRQVLLVEVTGGGQDGTCVVRLGQPEGLQQELAAWKACRPTGLRHDPVFMIPEPLSARRQLAALVYQDCQQFLGMERPLTLEEAFRGAVVRDNPKAASVADALTLVFDRFGHTFYHRATPEPHVGGQLVLNNRVTLYELLDRWNDETGLAQRSPTAKEARLLANSLPTIGTGNFLDPVYYLTFLLGRTHNRPPARDFALPPLVRGTIHGDLHGRNILLGLADGRVHWPTVIDWAEMRPDGPVGYDFAELETRLKRRVYPSVFSESHPLVFAQRVRDFEIELWEATKPLAAEETPPPEGGWDENLREPSPDIRGPGTARTGAETGPVARLRALLLHLRGLARTWLGKKHRPSSLWLDDYSFLLGCSGLFDAQTTALPRGELVSAFLSAGVSLAYYHKRRKGPATPNVKGRMS